AMAWAAQRAGHFRGMPEGRIGLAGAAPALAAAPKSNTAYAALNQAMQDVREQANEPVPLHLRNAVTGMMKDMGYGKDYKYSHNYEGHFDEQEYLPPSLKGRRYYHPGEEGAERQIGRRLSQWWSGKPADDRSDANEPDDQSA
nr:replication-associated recombination protein A [Chloroflexota bacterium]